MKKLVKKAKKAAVKVAAKAAEKAVPFFMRENVNFTKDDLAVVTDFYEHFGLTMNPVMKSIIDGVNAGKPWTLDDQVLFTRILLSEIAGRGNVVWDDELWDGIAIDSSKTLLAANKAKAKK